MRWEWYHVYIIIGIVAVVVGVAVYIIRKKYKKKVTEQESLVNQHKVTTSILVLEKKMKKVSEASMPKSVQAQIPKIYKLKKMPIVKAKIGPQVMDFLCDEKIFDKLPVRKTVKVELAGIFIAGYKGSKK
ncbi:hypothetical protein ACFL20_10235 [Spirochaetota bacterium]